MTDRGPFLSSPFVARAARWGLLAWSIIGIVLLIVGAFWYVLRPIRVIFPPIVVALIVVYLLAPAVARLERRGVRRGGGTPRRLLGVFPRPGACLPPPYP